MGEDTCARAKVLAKGEARNLHAFSWRLIFSRRSCQAFYAFLLRVTPCFPSVPPLLAILMLVI